MLKKYSPPGHLRWRGVCFYIETDWKKFSITSFALQWMGAVWRRVQTADKNINNPHNYSSKLTSNGFFWLKYSNRGSHLTESSIHILLLAPLKKVNRSDSEEKYAQIKHCLIKHFWTNIFLFLISSLDCSDETPLNLEWPEGEWNFIRFSFLGLLFL